MESINEKILEAKAVQKEITELEEYYSRYKSQKALARILELRDTYQMLVSVIHS